MSKQTENGRNGELRAARMLNERGYWAHVLAKSESGSQPFDVIAAKGDGGSAHVWMVDSKWVNGDRPSFTLGRVEANQLSAMEYAAGYAGLDEGSIGFVIFFERDDGNPRFAPFRLIEGLMRGGKRSIHMDELVSFSSCIK